jgi:hypothetical protein
MSPTPAEDGEPDASDGGSATTTGAADALRQRMATLWWQALRRFKSYVERGSAS